MVIVGFPQVGISMLKRGAWMHIMIQPDIQVMVIACNYPDPIRQSFKSCRVIYKIIRKCMVIQVFCRGLINQLKTGRLDLFLHGGGKAFIQ
jgi:hypothetical protein